MSAAAMTTAQALRDLGVLDDTLPAAAREALDREGFVAFPAAVGARQLEPIRARLDDLLEAERHAPASESGAREGAPVLYDLMDKGDVLWPVLFHPLVLASAAHVLRGELRVMSYNFRGARPGHGGQALHADADVGADLGTATVFGAIVALEDFTPDNGATRVVPRSHVLGHRPEEAMPDPEATHPDEVQLLGPAGTIFAFHASLWHGGTLNRSRTSLRFALHPFYVRRDAGPRDDRRPVRPETAARMTPAQRFLVELD